VAGGKQSGAATASFLLGSDRIDAEVLSDGSATYTHGVAGLVSENRGGTTKVYHSDALNSVRALTNTSGTVTDTRSRDAFGGVVTTTGTTPTPFGFAGGFGYQQDSETGLMRLGHRMYDSSTGRFISRDPIRDGYNWYAYCNNDPVNAVDPTGQGWASMVVGGLVGVAAGVATGNILIGIAVGGIAAAALSNEVGNSLGDVVNDGIGGALIGGEGTIVIMPLFPRPIPTTPHPEPGLPGGTPIYRGGANPTMPEPGTEFSGQIGPPITAGPHIPHGTMNPIGTVDDIVGGGGSVSLFPEPYVPTRPDLLNPGHVNVILGPGYQPPGSLPPGPVPNPIPAAERIPKMIQSGKL
jgi:RHS repeat-associated protein